MAKFRLFRRDGERCGDRANQQQTHAHGRLILDVYHRDFFEAHQGERSFTRNGLAITERKVMYGDRLVVELDYGPECLGDRFDWQVFTPNELHALGDMHGLTRRVACSDFNDNVPPMSSNPRMQFVFEKRWRQ